MPAPDPALARRILDLQMADNDAYADTVRGYLIALLREVWTSGEGFSGKRPFGNGGWENDLWAPLVRAGLVLGTVDEYGYVEVADTDAGDRLIHAAIDELGRVPA